MRQWIELGLLLAVVVAACGSPGDVAELAQATADPQGHATDLDGECEQGVAASCTRVGVQLAHGTFGRVKDQAAAVPFLERGCKGGDVNGCHELGVMYEHGRGVERDYARAAELYETACAAKVANSCHNLAVFYEHGRGVVESADRANDYYAQACAAGSTLSCDRRAG